MKLGELRGGVVMRHVSNTLQTVLAIIGSYSFTQQLFIMPDNGDIAGNQADTMSTSGELRQVKTLCFFGKDTGHWAEDLEDKSHTQPSLGREELVFLLARSLVNSMKMGLVPIAKEGLVPVLKGNIILMRRHA